MLKTRMFLTAVLAMLLLGMVQAADERIKPFFLAGVQGDNMASVVDATKQKLTAAGFGIVGEYSPYAGVTIIGVTNGALIQAAGETEFGVFGAAQIDEQTAKVHVPHQHANGRHDDVVDKRADDFAEGATNDDAHGHINHVATHGKFLEFFKHVISPYVSGLVVHQILGFLRCFIFSSIGSLAGSLGCRILALLHGCIR